MKLSIFFICALSLSAHADDAEMKLQEKRTNDRAQELRDAQYAGNPNKAMIKLQRLDEEREQLNQLQKSRETGAAKDPDSLEERMRKDKEVIDSRMMKTN